MRLVCIFICIIISTVCAIGQQGEFVVQSGHNLRITCSAISPEHKYVATASGDQTIIVWSYHNQLKLRQIRAHDKAINAIVFVDETTLISAGDDGMLRAWDISTGKLIREKQAYGIGVAFLTGLESMVIDREQGWLATGNSGGKVAFWKISDFSKLGEIAVSYTDVRLDYSEISKNLVAVTYEKVVHMDPQDKVVLKEKIIKGKSLKTLAVHPTRDEMILTPKVGYDMYYWDLKSDNFHKQIKPVGNKSIQTLQYTDDGTALLIGANNQVTLFSADDLSQKMAFSADKYPINSLILTSDKLIAIPTKNALIFYGNETGKKAFVFGDESVAQRTQNIASSSLGKQIYLGNSRQSTNSKMAYLGKWNLKYGNYEVIDQFPHKFINVYTVQNDQRLAIVSSDNKLYLRGNTRAYKPITLETKASPAQSISAFKPSTQQLYTARTVGNLMTWNIDEDKLLDEQTREKIDNRALAPHPSKNHMAIYEWDAVRIWNMDDWSIVHELKTSEFLTRPHRLSYSSDGKFLAIGFGGLYKKQDGTKVFGDNVVRLFDGSSYGKVRELKGLDAQVASIAFTQDDRHILAGDIKGKIVCWDVASGQVRYNINGHIMHIRDIQMMNQNRFVTTSVDNTVKIWNLTNGDLIATLLTDNKGEYIIVTKEGYYLSTARAYGMLGFRRAGETYPFEQFDLVYNRPDLVLKKLGMSEEAVVRLYHKAYTKRLSRLGFTEDDISPDLHLPEVEWLNPPKKITTQERKLALNIKASDSKYQLRRLHLYVNNVPVLGMQGMPLQGKTLQKELELNLSQGNNKIEVSVQNEKGIESIRKSYSMVYEGPATKPDLYLVAIGVSDYDDDDYDLSYAAKDAQDIMDLYSTKSQKYGKIHLFPFLDKAANAEDIKKVKDQLMQSSVDDEVMLFVAGHGLLDEELDYYFATHNVDFYKPSKKGLKYTDLENIIDGIPARKKTMFIDACNSGEIDKEESEQVVSIENDSHVSSRGFSTVKKKSYLGIENSFELMQQLFADVSRGTGATIISSASGTEFAYESPQWNNGVFTYALLNGLKSGDADQNSDNLISVSELKNYVYDQVESLTRGKQHPTSRRENLENDFVVW